MKRLITKANTNPYWVFILALYATKQMIFEVIDTVKTNMPALNTNEANNITPIFNSGFFNNLIQVVTVIILFFVYRNYFRMREREEMQKRKIEVLQYFTNAVIFSDPQKWVTKIEADEKNGYITKKEKEDILFTVIKPK